MPVDLLQQWSTSFLVLIKIRYSIINNIIAMNMKFVFIILLAVLFHFSEVHAQYEGGITSANGIEMPAELQQAIEAKEKEKKEKQKIQDEARMAHEKAQREAQKAAKKAKKEAEKAAREARKEAEKAAREAQKETE